MYYIIEVKEQGALNIVYPVTENPWHDNILIDWIDLLPSVSFEDLKTILASKNWTYFIGQGKGTQWLMTCPSEYEQAYNGFFHKIVEQSHDEIYVCDGEGRTLYCNKTFEKNYGLRREDMLGKTAMYLTEQGYSDQSPVPEVLRTHRTVTLNQKTVTGKNLMITATPHLTEENEIAFIVENCRDTTELEQIRQQLEKKSDEAERYKQEAEYIRMQDASEVVISQVLSKNMCQVMATAERVANTDATVLILGESGSGKNHIAKTIHQKSRRQKQPFICINCSAIAPSLFESEIFGYAAGAFTGAASKGKMGQISLAEGGTLFLDEIGEVPLALQVKLLELIQEKRYMPVGGVQYKIADVRIIAATNRNLQQLVIEKTFREDLFYRLKVVEIAMPPLRDRSEDINGLLDNYLKHFNHEYGTQKQLNAETRQILNHYHWPGNVRELQNLMHNLVIMAPGRDILPTDLPGSLILDALPTEGPQEFGDLDHLVDAFEKAIVIRCVEQCGSSYKVAKVLNISQSRASRLIRKYCGEQSDPPLD